MKKSVVKIVLLLKDILFLWYNIAKGIIIPYKQRKGNVFSSLYDFFIGTIEKLSGFEHGLFRMSAIFQLKYVKQVILIIGGFLFLLSSLEWSNEKTIIYPADLSETSIGISANETVAVSIHKTIDVCAQVQLVKKYFTYTETSLWRGVFVPHSSKSYLSFRSIRV